MDPATRRAGVAAERAAETARRAGFAPMTVADHSRRSRADDAGGVRAGGEPRFGLTREPENADSGDHLRTVAWVTANIRWSPIRLVLVDGDSTHFNAMPGA